MIGFIPSNVDRHPIYGERIAGKIGYVERHNGHTYFCDVDGTRLAKVLRYKDHQAPEAHASACGGSFVPSSYE